MSGTLSPSVQNLDDLCHKLALLCGSATPLELFELLAKTLHALTQGQPVALYRRLSTETFVWRTTIRWKVPSPLTARCSLFIVTTI